jgi:DNA-binding protein H-NS
MSQSSISRFNSAVIALSFQLHKTKSAMATLSLADIESQIREREEQISQLRAAVAKQREEEISAVTQDLRRKIDEYNISAKELGLTGKYASLRRRIAAAAAGPTYRGPNGEAWVGGTRGRKPRWLAEELARGKSLSDLAA